MDMDVLRRRLSCEEINAMPLFHYEGPVQVIRTLEDWKNALPDLRSADLLGFDTETRPSFRKGRRNFPALIQLATANAVYLVQLAFLPFGPHVVEILANPDQVKAGVGIRETCATLPACMILSQRGLWILAGWPARTSCPARGCARLRPIFLAGVFPKARSVQTGASWS